MKLSVNFDSLWQNVRLMGANKVDLDIGDVWRQELDPLDAELAQGREVNIHDLETDSGILSFEGRQVVLYIRDHGNGAQAALDDGGSGRKFHIAQCQTLDSMKRRNRFERYFAKNNLSKEFQIEGYDEHGKQVQGMAALNVCKNCLKYLNYKESAKKKKSSLDKIVETFDMGEFFSTYSSIFRHMPQEMKFNASSGYTKNWADISANARKAAGYICSQCAVRLHDFRHLLHTHHINGVKNDNSPENLQVLCIDCHRKQPLHDHMFVKHEDMQTINQLRREQGLIVKDAPDWQTAQQTVDPAFYGVLDHARNKRYGPPEIGYELTDVHGRVVDKLELAWPSKKLGIAVDKPQDIDGWQLLSLKEAMDFFFQPSQRR